MLKSYRALAEVKNLSKSAFKFGSGSLCTLEIISY